MPQIDLISLRQGYVSDWEATNPILYPGEPGVEIETGKMKIGNGTTPWVDLPYTASEGEAGPPGDDGIHIAPTPPSDVDILWGDTTEVGDGTYPGPPGPVGPQGPVGPPGTVAGSFNVVDYGAIGNGIADDTVAVQAAVTAAAVKGGCVSFPGGTFIVGNVTCSTRVSLRGAGQGSTIVKCKTGTTGNWFQIGSYSEVSDLWLDANGQNVTALWLYQAARSMLHHLYLNNGGPTSNAIWALGTAQASASHGIHFSDLNIIGFGGYGIVLDDFAYDSELVNVWIGTCGVGIHTISGAQQLTGCHVWGCTGDGVFCDPGGARIVNSYFESNGGAGLHIKNAAFRGGLSIIGTTIWRNAASGIWLETGYRARIIGCVLEDNTGPGVLLDSHQNAIVEGCQFDNSSGTAPQTRAVQETGSSTGNIITNNQALDSMFPAGGAFEVIGAATRLFVNNNNNNRELKLMHPLAGQSSSAAIDGSAGQTRTLAFQTDNSNRWLVRASATAEAGTDAGSDFEIVSRTDTGAAKSTPFLITRSTGAVRMASEVSVGNIFRHTGSWVGFYNANPINRPTVPAAATDPATTMALVNALRTALVNLGLVV